LENVYRVILAFAPQEQCRISENPANMTGTAHGKIISNKMIRLHKSNQTLLQYNSQLLWEAYS
jgi:hypothetical protein